MKTIISYPVPSELRFTLHLPEGTIIDGLITNADEEGTPYLVTRQDTSRKTVPRDFMTIPEVTMVDYPAHEIEDEYFDRLSYIGTNSTMATDISTEEDHLLMVHIYELLP